MKIAFIVQVVILILVSCHQLKPSDEGDSVDQRDGSGGLTFTIDAKSAQFLIGIVNQVCVAIFTVETGHVGSQEGADYLSAFNPSGGSVTINDVTVGDKELVVELMDEEHNVLGRGTARITVAMGMQTIQDPIRIKLIPDNERRVTKAIDFNFLFVDPANVNLVTYQTLKPILNVHCASSCHNSSVPSAGLKLDRFPFIFEPATRPAVTDQSQIVSELTDAMRSTDYPMPPQDVPNPLPRVPAPDIRKFDQWRADGLLAHAPELPGIVEKIDHVDCDWQLDGAPAGWVSLIKTSENHFVGQAKDMHLAGLYKTTVNGLSPTGGTIFSIQLDDLYVRNGRPWESTVTVPYSQPRIGIPVVIEP